MAHHEVKAATMPLYLRYIWMALGVFIFFWIGYEDRSTFLPVLLGGGIALGLALQLKHSIDRVGVASQAATKYLLYGLIFGGLAMPLAALSMLVKLSLHAHVPPDFSAAQIQAVLLRSPIWAIAGAMIGLAAGLRRSTRP